MKRADIEQWLKKNGQNTIVLVYNQTDKLGVYCELKGGFLCDYTGHRVNRAANIWGFVAWENGQPSHIPFEEVNA